MLSEDECVGANHALAGSEETQEEGGSGSAGRGGAPDCAQRVFAMAPFWVYAHIWHMERHCNSSTGPPFTICFSCPLTSDEMLKLYRERQLKGSNLIVGLTPEAASQHGGTDIPAAFLRTLAYLFELVKKGLEYAPLTEEDIQAGAPPLNWAPPLWPTEPVMQPVSLEDPMQLFQAAPYWCYLYNHEPQRSKKTPPKTAAQMASMYMSGHLPLWAPVLGLESEVARFNSLPPCLFMTLGSVASLLAAGQCIKAVGIRELQRFDKFIGYRSATGSTNALPVITHQDSGSGNSSQQAMRTASPSGRMVHTRDSSFQSSGSLFNNQAAHHSVPNGSHAAAAPWQASRAQGCNGEVSGSFAVPHSPGVASIPRSNSDASGNWAAAASQTYSHPFQQQAAAAAAPPFQHRRGHSGSNPTSVACVPAFSSAALAPISPLSSPASPANPLGVATVPPPIPWQTALFKLFTSDASRGRFQPLWWYLDLSSPSGMHGPISAEHMIIGYLQGTLGDTSMVCGTTSECTAGHRPSYDSFEPIGVLLEKINQGGHYVLVTLNEMLGLPPPVQPAAYPPLPTYQPAPATPLPTYTYQPPVSSAPLPTYTQPPLPAYATNGTYAPSPAPPAITTSVPPAAFESSRMVQHQRGPSGPSSLVGAPPPHGLPPVHHPLSPRNLNILRNGHNRHKSHHSTSRTSLMSAENSQLAALAAQQAQHSAAQHGGSSRDSGSSAGHSEGAAPGGDSQQQAAAPQGEDDLQQQHKQQQQQPAAAATISLAAGQKAIGSYMNDRHCTERDSAGDQLARKSKPPALNCSNTNVEQSVMSLST